MPHCNSNASDGEGHESRKKRLNSQDKRDVSKKVRPTEQKVNENGAIAEISDRVKDENMDSSSNNKTRTSNLEASNILSTKTGQTRNVMSDERPKHRWRDQVWDLESALLYLVQVSGTGDADSPKSRPNNYQGDPSSKDGGDKLKSNPKSIDTAAENFDREDKTDKMVEVEDLNSKKDDIVQCNRSHIREYLTNEMNSWITFRVAHAGDASTIAQWYRRHRSEDRHNRRRRRKAKAANRHETAKKIGKEDVERDLEEPEIYHKPSSSNEEEINNNSNNNSNDDSKDNRRTNKSDDDTDHETNEEDDGLSSSSLQLEHWLAEGLGDENNFPFVHGLLAYVHRWPKERTCDTKTDEKKGAPENPGKAKPSTPSTSIFDHKNDDLTYNNKRNYLAAVVLMSLSWNSGKRNLRIEWISVDSSVPQTKDEGLHLRQKVWLRIHMLSSMTACKAISIDDDVLLSASTKEQIAQAQSKFSPLNQDSEETSDGAGSKETVSVSVPGTQMKSSDE